MEVGLTVSMQVHEEHERRMLEATMLERHIMESQARAMVADERELDKLNSTCRGYPIGLPPPPTHFRSCINNELLRKHNLITPNDYTSEQIPTVPPPSAPSVPDYARDTSSVLNRQSTSYSNKSHVTNDYEASVEFDVAEEQDFHGHSECSDTETDNSYFDRSMLKPMNNLWQEHTSEFQREQNRIDLANLEARTNFLKNPRHQVSRAEIGETRSLLKPRNKPPKEIGIKPKTTKTVDKKIPIFLASPPIIRFNEYKVGQAYEQTLELKNVSSVLQPCRVVPPKSNYFSVGLGQFPGDSGLVAPGMSCQFTVRFIADSLGDFADEILVQTQSSEAIKVALVAKRNAPILTLPEVIDVGFCLTGACRVSHITVKNSGGDGRFCLLNEESWPATNFKTAVNPECLQVAPFSISPSVFDLKSGESTLLEVVFQPTGIETYQRNICMICDNCQVRNYTIRGIGQIARVELVDIEGGLKSPLPGAWRDVAAQHYYVFDDLNPFTYLQRRMKIRNAANIDLPFSWKVTKPHLVSPSARETGDLELPVERFIDHSFMVEPAEGVLAAGMEAEFLVVFAPPEVRDFHSVLHLVLHEIPMIHEASTDENNKLAGPLQTSIQDATVLEVEVVGKCVPLSVTINPSAVIFPGKLTIGSTARRIFQFNNHSMSPILFQWDFTNGTNLAFVEPPIGELDGMTSCFLEVIVSGTEPGKISETLTCFVENLEEPIYLKIEAEMKGPEVVIDVPDLNFGLVRLGETVGQTFTIRNLSSLQAKWTLQESPACAALLDPMAESEFKFDPSAGELRPLEEKMIEVRFQPTSVKTVNTVFELSVDDGNEVHLATFAEVQVPKVCLQSCQLDLRDVYVGVTVTQEVILFNQTLLETNFKWLQVEGTHSDQCTVELAESQGNLGPREKRSIQVNFTGLSVMEISNVKIPCSIGGMDNPLVLALTADVRGLDVSYISLNEDSSIRDDLTVDFGDSVALNSVVTRNIIIRNNSAIAASFSTRVEHFSGKPPTPPSTSRGEKRDSPNKTRGLLRKTANITDPSSKSEARAQAEISRAILSAGLGAAFVITPANSTLQPFGELKVEVKAYCDMWGMYADKIICTIDDLNQVIPVTMGVMGNPLNFQLTAASPGQRPIIRFGTHVSGVKAISRQIRVNNTSPCDIRLDWQMYNMQADDHQIIDLIVTYGRPFPPIDEDGNEIIPSNTPEPEKIERAPTGFIPDSPDTVSQKAVGSICPPASSAASVDIDDDDDCEKASTTVNKLISVNYRLHEGIESSSPFSISPNQVHVPARGYSLVTVTFTPPDNESVMEDMDLIGYALGFLSLEDKDALLPGYVRRKQTYDVDQLSIDFTTRVKPACLTIECLDDDNMMFQNALSELLHISKSGDPQVLAESVQIRRVKLSNFNETAISFKLQTDGPFILVSPPAQNGFSGDQTSQSLLLQMHKSIFVELGFYMTLDLLKYVELLESEEHNEAEVEGVSLLRAGDDGCRQLQFKQNLEIKFNNGTEQIVPLEALLTIPSLQLTKSHLDFGTCLVGQERSLEVELSNRTSSNSYWTTTVEVMSDTCTPETFRLIPSSGLLDAYITHVSNSNVLIKIYFTAKHNEDYSSTFVIRGMLGESPVKLVVQGRGSYDGKHEALVNH
ncbi:deleted in lung and esophageal cancer protein 1-like isoform X2 [Tubulanus polymorphus]|uniref:deleted in lung and esophageal cancer protein 1-like isoform X2 n=1 Tax=Tubulanus polymorphus TaxID=672921 RepID=UPI003DA51A5A